MVRSASLGSDAGAESEWKLTIYGFAEADFMLDSTRSFNDSLNTASLPTSRRRPVRRHACKPPSATAASDSK